MGRPMRRHTVAVSYGAAKSQVVPAERGLSRWRRACYSRYSRRGLRRTQSGWERPECRRRAMRNRAVAILGGALLGVGCMTGVEPPANEGSGSEPLESQTASLSFAAAPGASVSTVVSFSDPAPHVVPTVQARAAQVAAAASSAAVALAAGANKIDYAGGPVIHAPVVFYIWYGGWAGNSAPAILTDFANSI